ncbi:dTDP-4-dehydrorhamnose 3,5-epimerase family protein [Methanococcoides burtonii]|uniref:dTDP-4-dehydrorhamnose 3,5-epimerase related protein n=1 Tax=Methanococcoides burtonii (strain DSM 6242 / NBRC 107633 / OCM 468 / ACE-M) TaxID=259564 RepID=Q12VL8_METBU|nr:dTDP-4-dehydrorhamnose 3,5-epimerase family protein [Methanococcoides burtonii]ABE52508.1 dTDP-4-dehydrorhamnose 3,5-epimerase related protein [Methanococcoides burtonii DSM 6242]
MIEGVIVNPVKIITGENGNVMHALKAEDDSYHGFGEAYFSTVNCGAIKAWKRHHEMTLNIVVPQGEIMFVLYDDRLESNTRGQIMEIKLSTENYQRLTIPPMVWMGFKGMGKDANILINIANIQHDPNESDHLDSHKNNINYDWG